MTGFSNIGLATGPAGVDSNGNPAGDLSGSYPNPLVVGIWDNPVDGRPPANGDTLVYNGGEWIPTPSPSNTAALFKGVLDASTDPPVPDVENFPGLSDGFTWLVQVGGNADIGGITGWLVGDYAIYSSGNWYKLSNSSFGWGLTGNAGTIPTINYVGTSDLHDFSIRANNVEGLLVRTSGDVTANHNLTVTQDITGSNLRTSGDVHIDGGNIFTASPTFNVASDPTSNGGTINIGYNDKDNNLWTTNVVASGQQVTFKLSGSSDKNAQLVFSGEGDTTSAIYAFAQQLKLYGADGIQLNGYDGAISAILSNSTLFQAINSQIGEQIFYLDSTGNMQMDGNVAVDGGSVTTAQTTANLFNAVATTVNLGGGATAGLNLGNSAGTNVMSGTTKFPQGLSGSLTTLTDGTPYLRAGGNIAVTSASNGPVTVAFNTTTPPVADDVLVYNGTTWTPSSIINTLQTSYQTVKCVEAGGILAGDVCYIKNAGGSANYPSVEKALASDIAKCKGVIGLATTNIANNAIGTVQTYGQLIGPVDTNTFSQGAPLYVSPTTPGAVTEVKPQGPNVAFQIGFVTRNGQPNTATPGIVFISPIQQTDTKNLSDLIISSPAEHDILTYEPATLSWKNKQRLWAPNTQTSLAVDNGTTITAANFLNVVYLPLVTQGGANKTLNATTPIERLAKNETQYGRELWLHNVDNNKTITIPSGGSVKLDGGVSLVLAAGAMAKFMWSAYGGGNGFWIQTSKALTVG